MERYVFLVRPHAMNATDIRHDVVPLFLSSLNPLPFIEVSGHVASLRVDSFRISIIHPEESPVWLPVWIYPTRCVPFPSAKQTTVRLRDRWFFQLSRSLCICHNVSCPPRILPDPDAFSVSRIVPILHPLIHQTHPEYCLMYPTTMATRNRARRTLLQYRHSADVAPNVRGSSDVDTQSFPSKATSSIVDVATAPCRTDPVLQVIQTSSYTSRPERVSSWTPWSSSLYIRGHMLP